MPNTTTDPNSSQVEAPARLPRRALQAALCLAFALLLWLPLLQQQFQLLDLSTVKLREKRRAAELPSIKPQNIWNWPQQFSKYYRDAFGFQIEHDIR